MKNVLPIDSRLFTRFFLLAPAAFFPVGDPGQTATGFDFAKALPASTSVYFSFPDLDRTEKAAVDLPWSKLCREDEVKAFIEKPAAYAREKGFPALWKQVQKETGEDLSFLENIRIHSFDLALTSFRVPTAKGDRGELSALISIGLGDDAAKVEATLRKAIQKARRVTMEETSVEGTAFFVLTSTRPQGFDKDAPFDSLAWFVYQGRLVASLNRQPAEMALRALMGKADSSTLANDGEFQKAMSKVGGAGADFRFFLKVGETYRQVMKAVESQFGAREDDEVEHSFRLFPDLTPILRAIDTLGIGDLGFFSMASRSQGTHSVTQTFLSAKPGPKTGLLRLFSTKSIDRSLLSKVPKEVQDFSIFGMNPVALWDAAWKAGETADPEKANEARAMLAAFEGQLGVKIKEDLFDSLGEICIMYSMPMQSLMAATPEIYLLVEARDLAKLEKSMTTLIQFAAEQSDSFQMKENTFEGGKSYTLSFPDLRQGNPFMANFTPTFAYADRFLVVGLSKSGVRRAVKKLQSPDLGEGAAAIPDFAKFSASFPKEVTGLSYADPRPPMTAVYQMLQMFGPMASSSFPGEFPLDFALLPSAATITKHYFGGAGYSVATDDGWQSNSISPFGADLLLGVVSMSKTLGGIAAGIATEAKAMNRGGRQDEEEDAMEEEPPMAPPPEPIDRSAEIVKQDLLDLKSGITIFKIETGKYPAALEDLLKTTAELPEGCLPGKTAIPLDPWKKAYVFFLDPAGKSYRLRSKGPNGIDDQGKGDDVVGN